MEYQQLVQPNLTVVGQSDECLEYVRKIFNAPAEYNTATDAWNASQYQHAGEQPPTNVSVPVWFSWTGTVDGVTANYGHVACSVNGTQFYSVSAIGDQIFDSLQDLMDFIGGGIKYLGFSEDINSTRVVQGENIVQLQPGDIDKVIKMGLQRQPTAQELGDQDYANNAALCIETIWNNGGEAIFNASQNPGTISVVINGTTYVPGA